MVKDVKVVAVTEKEEKVVVIKEVFCFHQLFLIFSFIF